MNEPTSFAGGPLMLLDKERPIVRLVMPDQLEKPESVGYELQKKALISMGLGSLFYGEKRVLVFGLPGTGLIGFTGAVLWTLKEHYDIKPIVLDLICKEIILETEITRALGVIEKKLDDAIRLAVDRNYLLVLIIENPDSLTSKINNYQKNKSILGVWLYLLLKKTYDKAFVICTSDDPSKIDAGLLRFFKYPIYLRHLDLESIKVIFQTKMHRKDNLEVAKQLYNSVDKDGFNLVSAEVVKAVDRVEALTNFETLSIDEAAKSVRKRIYPCYPKEDVNDYENRNKTLIECSKSFVLQYWSKRFDEFTSTRK